MAVLMAELKSGLSILCGGSIDEKARTTFDLYDLNGDGTFLVKR